MKKVLTAIVAYSFVFITIVQLLVNILFIFQKEFYLKYSFYLSQIGGLSVTYLIPMVAVAFLFKFCTPSRICAIAQIFLTLLWLIIQKDNVYNIIAQITIGAIALILTFKLNNMKKIIEKYLPILIAITAIADTKFDLLLSIGFSEPFIGIIKLIGLVAAIVLPAVKLDNFKLGITDPQNPNKPSKPR